MLHIEEMAVGTIEALRGYLVSLRRARGLSQEELGVQMGLSRSAVIEWETARTKTPFAEPILLAIQQLGTFDDLQRLVGADATAARGQEVALQRIASALSEGARDQIANVMRMLAEETRTGRLTDEVFFTKAQHMLVLLDGLSVEERKTATAIFRLLADGVRQPQQRAGLLARLFGTAD